MLASSLFLAALSAAVSTAFSPAVISDPALDAASSRNQVPIIIPQAQGANAIITNNGLGRLPALGWNSWNTFHCNIDEEKVLTAANDMVRLGLSEAGYQYVNIDDCWSVRAGRDVETNRLIPDPERFPSGISGVADEVHSLGLSLGLYSSAGEKTCAGYPASLGYEKVDAQTFAEWGVDYLKYDNCNAGPTWADECNYCLPDSEHVRPPFPNGTCPTMENICPPGYDFTKSKTYDRFRRMRDALAALKRPIQYALCQWGEADVQSWGHTIASSWRATADISPHWPRIVELLNIVSFKLANTDFWGHSDADMLEVGNGELTEAETRSHFALWAAMKSPLFIGTTFATLSEHDLNVLKNPYLIQFNQDPLVGRPATPYKWGTNPDWTWNSTYPAEFWSGRTSVKLDDSTLKPVDNTRVKAVAMAMDLHWDESDDSDPFAESQYLIDQPAPTRELVLKRRADRSQRLSTPKRPHSRITCGMHKNAASHSSTSSDAALPRRQFQPSIETLSEDSVLVLLSNWSDKPDSRAVVWTEVPDLPANARISNGGPLYEVIDVWTGKSLGCFNRGYSTAVQPHDTAALWIRTCRADK